MKRKQELLQKEQSLHNSLGDGVAWSRGSLIGKGAFGSVYLATSKKSKSPNGYFPSVMAVKSAEVSVSGSIQKEKEVLTNLHGCPYVIQCFGEETTASKNGDMVYNLLLENASAGTLANLIKKSFSCGGLPGCDVKRYTRSLLRGLHHIHEHGYVHCDLKPENILLVPNATRSNSFVAKISDFGLAKKATQSKKRRLNPYLRGTAMYMAPEAVADNVQEPPSDIWSLGCVVLEMLTGKPAWEINPNSNTDYLLCKIGFGHQLPEIPSEVSKEGRDFLKGCFVRKAMYRLTAEMLLNHPFVAGEEDEEGQAAELEEALEVEAISSSYLSDGTDDEFSSSIFLDDCSEEDSSVCSWPADDEEMNNQFIGSSMEEATMGGQETERISSSVIACNGDSISMTSKTILQYPASTISAGGSNDNIHN